MIELTILEMLKTILQTLKNLPILYSIGWLILSPVPVETLNSRDPIIKIIGGAQKPSSQSQQLFQEMLFKHFPDFESRVSMKKRQTMIYNQAIQKLKEY